MQLQDVLINVWFNDHEHRSVLWFNITTPWTALMGLSVYALTREFSQLALSHFILVWLMTEVAMGQGLRVPGMYRV